MNYYPSKRKGYYIYTVTDRNGTQYRADRKYNCGYRKSATFHVLEEAVAWLDALVGE